ncbi:MAG: YdcF family protein [Burkholderiaceae bacterium]|nr:YdcF family protein [Burkholderiaceae bacterium]
MEQLGKLLLNQLGNPLTEPTAALHPADVVVVLGSVVYPDGQPSQGLRLRVSHGVNLVKQGLGKFLFVTGGQVSGLFIEGEVMKSLALADGLEEEQIIVDTLALSTVENAQKTKEFMTSKQLNTAIVVTSPYHLKRAVLIFQDAGIQAQGSAAFSPDDYSLNSHANAIAHEYLAWLKYFITAF